MLLTTISLPGILKTLPDLFLQDRQTLLAHLLDDPELWEEAWDMIDAHQAHEEALNSPTFC